MGSEVGAAHDSGDLSGVMEDVTLGMEAAVLIVVDVDGDALEPQQLAEHGGLVEVEIVRRDDLAATAARHELEKVLFEERQCACRDKRNGEAKRFSAAQLIADRAVHGVRLFIADEPRVEDLLGGRVAIDESEADVVEESAVIHVVLVCRCF